MLFTTFSLLRLDSVIWLYISSRFIIYVRNMVSSIDQWIFYGYNNQADFKVKSKVFG